MPVKKAVTKLFQAYWRVSRGLTIGAQGIVFDSKKRILLVQHGYRPGWHFPGGGVEWGETVVLALKRELLEETGVVVTETPELHGIFANHDQFPGDHVAVFVIRGWEQKVILPKTIEITGQDFFAADDLPLATVGAVRRRLAEILGGTAPAEIW